MGVAPASSFLMCRRVFLACSSARYDVYTTRVRTRLYRPSGRVGPAGGVPALQKNQARNWARYCLVVRNCITRLVAGEFSAGETRDLNARETQELTAEYRKWEQMLRELNERMLRHMGKDPSQWVVQVQDQEVHVRYKSEVPEQESPQ